MPQTFAFIRDSGYLDMPQATDSSLVCAGRAALRTLVSPRLAGQARLWLASHDEMEGLGVAFVCRQGLCHAALMSLEPLSQHVHWFWQMRPNPGVSVYLHGQ